MWYTTQQENDMKMTLEERETNLSMSAGDRSVWNVFSDDPVMQRKLESVGAIPVRDAVNGEGKFYTLPANQITIRMQRKEMPDDKKAELASRMRKVAETYRNTKRIDLRIDVE
jgi:hypothetical protein